LNVGASSFLSTIILFALIVLDGPVREIRVGPIVCCESSMAAVNELVAAREGVSSSIAHLCMKQAETIRYSSFG